MLNLDLVILHVVVPGGLFSCDICQFLPLLQFNTFSFYFIYFSIQLILCKFVNPNISVDILSKHSLVQYMNSSSNQRGWRTLMWYISWGLSFFQILSLYLWRGTWYFLVYKLYSKQSIFYFLVFIFYNYLMKIYFPKKFL